MAVLALMGEPIFGMSGRGCLVKILLMTRPAIRRGSLESTVMASSALKGAMPPGEGKRG